MVGCRTINFVFFLAAVAESGAIYPVAWKDGPCKDTEYVPDEVDESSVWIPEVGQAGYGGEEGIGVEARATGVGVVTDEEKGVGDGGDGEGDEESTRWPTKIIVACWWIHGKNTPFLF